MNPGAKARHNRCATPGAALRYHNTGQPLNHFSSCFACTHDPYFNNPVNALTRDGLSTDWRCPTFSILRAPTTFPINPTRSISPPAATSGAVTARKASPARTISRGLYQHGLRHDRRRSAVATQETAISCCMTRPARALAVGEHAASASSAKNAMMARMTL